MWNNLQRYGALDAWHESAQVNNHRRLRTGRPEDSGNPGRGGPVLQEAYGCQGLAARNGHDPGIDTGSAAHKGQKPDPAPGKGRGEESIVNLAPMSE